MIRLLALTATLMIGLASGLMTASAQATPEASAGGEQISPVVWQLLALDLAGETRHAPADPSAYTLQFLPDGTLFVRADCNQGSGTYQQTGYGLTLPPAVMTLVACPEGSLDSPYLTALNEVVAFAYARDTLVLTLADGGGAMVFTPMLTGVVWTWQEARGADAVTVPNPSAYTLTFDGAGSVLVLADCNQGSATYETDGTAISIVAPTMTRVACAEGSLFDRYVAAIESAIGFTFENGRLVLAQPDGSVLVFGATISASEPATPVAG